ncbi:MAG: hypothetical protein NTY67_14925, partial [Cyanobacteria bacterium]|nr:hypothetical protein [Cyanobacteriota bacterium]
LITDLRSFQVEVDGVQRSLLVWSEVPTSALKTAEANPKELLTSQLAVIKVGLINPNAATTGGYTWDELFKDAGGHSTIATIPWSEDRGSGLSIADLSAATLSPGARIAAPASRSPISAPPPCRCRWMRWRASAARSTAPRSPSARSAPAHWPSAI